LAPRRFKMGACCSNEEYYSDSESSEVDDGPMQQLDDHVWLGNEEAGKDLGSLKENGITNICGIGWDLEPHHKNNGMTYNICNEVYDSPGRNIMPTVKTCLEFIDEVKARNEKVLIHCHLGISRSACVATAYIMKDRKLTFVEALKFVRSKRSVAVPSLGFEYQLYAFQQENYSLDLSLYEGGEWDEQLEDYCKNVLLPRTKKLRKEADDGDYEGQDLYALTMNWWELIRLEVSWESLDKIRDEAVQILRSIQVDCVQDENSLKMFDDMFKLNVTVDSNGGQGATHHE